MTKQPQKSNAAAFRMGKRKATNFKLRAAGLKTDGCLQKSSHIDSAAAPQFLILNYPNFSRSRIACLIFSAVTG